MSRTKGGLNIRIYLAVDAHGMPVRALVTQGTVTDCPQAGLLIERLDADYLLADRGYDSNAIIEQARKQGMEAVISPKEKPHGAKALRQRTV